MKNVTCDRCGNEKHGLSGTELILRPGDTTSTEVNDLCRKCTAQLRVFLENKPPTQVTNITVNNTSRQLANQFAVDEVEDLKRMLQAVKGVVR